MGKWSIVCPKCSTRREYTAETCHPIPPCVVCAKAGDRESSEVNRALQQCDGILGKIDDLPMEGMEFGESVAEKVSGISETIERTRRVTDAQARALDNMEDGVDRWLENQWG